MRQKILLCNIFCQYFSEEQSVDFYAGNLLSRTFRFKKILIPCNFLVLSEVLYMKGPQQPFTTQGNFGNLFLSQCSLLRHAFCTVGSRKRLPDQVRYSSNTGPARMTDPLYIVHPYKTYTQKSGRFPSWSGRFSYSKKDYGIISIVFFE